MPETPKPDTCKMLKRFAAKIKKTDCWVWQGAKNDRGYGTFGKVYAHRFAYELFHGKIPIGLVIDHLCRTPLCVNPLHLEAVTNRENVVVRGRGPSAVNAMRTECINGHPYNKANTYIKPNGGRDCKACSRKRVAGWESGRFGRLKKRGTKRKCAQCGKSFSHHFKEIKFCSWRCTGLRLQSKKV